MINYVCLFPPVHGIFITSKNTFLQNYLCDCILSSTLLTFTVKLPNIHLTLTFLHPIVLYLMAKNIEHCLIYIYFEPMQCIKKNSKYGYLSFSINEF